ncbi:MAG: hypothetical protein AAF828_06640, partial [Bacteroidota bacterium]
MKKLHGLLLSCCILFCSLVSANSFPWDFSGQRQHLEAVNLHLSHPYVALLPAGEEIVVSPDPNQLRVVDLRGVDCYPQPDRLETCGAPDTLCVLLFTKSEERLPEIRFNLRFGEGIEYGGFAEINFSDDAVFPPPLTDLDVISDQNPESPSFLISGVTRDSGSVYICFGVRAECGADLETFPPTLSANWDYTTESGVFCEGNFDFPGDFTAEVITPRVAFGAPLPGNTNLGLPDGLACNTINITQTTVSSSASGYLLTADEYGFDDGITIAEVRRNGTVVDPANYTIDPTTGAFSYNVDASDDPIAFNELDQVQLCYQYTDCFPNVDYAPVYTVVSTCDGVICTGPAVENNTARLISDYPSTGATIAVGYTTVTDPVICTETPYVFDVSITASNTTADAGDVYNLSANLRACTENFFFLSMIEVVDPATNMPVGTLDPSIYTIRTTNSGLDVAGTVIIDLKENETVTGGNLIDIDGDGFFDDIVAGTETILRLTYDITCTDEDAANTIAFDPDAFTGCQFADIQVFGAESCGFRGINGRNSNTGAPDFNVNSTAIFSNAVDMFNGRMGYDFGLVGNEPSGGACNDLPPSTKRLRFEYNIGSSMVTDCPPGSSPIATFTFALDAPTTLTNDAVFSNFVFEDAGGTQTIITAPA